MLIEPMGLLHGDDAVQSVRSGLALPLHRGPAAFSLVRLIESPRHGEVVPVGAIPERWASPLARLTASPPTSPLLPMRPLVMGIVNVTPDSFSDGGRNLRPEDAIATGMAMIEAGAAILDLGAESTRPGAAPVSAAAEQARLLPVLAGLRGRGALLSVDTRNAATMRAALEAGAEMINDVTALAHDPDAAGQLAAACCPVVLTHMRGTPQTMAGLARYDDVAIEVVAELAGRIEAAMLAGIARDRIIVDPGFGFAKNHDHNVQLLRRLPILANLGSRVLIGLSRKRFIGALAGVDDPALRDPGSLAAGLAGLMFPGCILRVHDVPAAVQAVRVWQAIRG